MNIVIAGGGKIGQVLIEVLSQEGHDLMLIDKSETVLDNLISQFDITGLVGHGENYDDLVEAQTNEADVFIAVTEEDEINIISCLMARKLGAKNTIARVRKPGYYKHSQFFNTEMGISLIVNPELEAADEMKRLLLYPESISVEPFLKGKVHIHEFKVEEGSRLEDSDLFNFRKEFGDVLVCMIIRGKEVIIPSGASKIHSGDRIFVTGDEECIFRFIEKLGIKEKKIRSLMMVGGGTSGHYLLELLKDRDMQIKVFENRPQRAKLLSEKFPHVEVIMADGTDQRLLDEERISSFDAYISYTGIDEENILGSLFAVQKGVYKVLTKVSRRALLEVIDDSKINSIITPKTYAANHILKFVRNVQYSDSSEIEAVHKIQDGKVELSQILIISESRALNTKLKDLNIKKNSMLAAMVRDGEVFFPGGEDEILLGDRLILVSTDKIRTVEDILGD